MKRARYIALVLLGILLLLLCVHVVRWRQARSVDPDASFIMPRVLVTKVHITDHDPDRTRMVLDIQLVNAAPIGLALDSLNYSLGIEGVDVVRRSYPHTLHLPANDTAHISFPVVVDSRKLLQRLKELGAQGLDSVHYDMDVRFHSGLVFWQKKPLEVRSSVYAPLFKVMQVALGHPRIRSLGLKNSSITVDMALYNPNVFPFAFKDTRLKLRLDDGQVIATRIDSAVHVPRQDTVVVQLPLDLAPGPLIGATFDALVKPAKTPFSYELSLVLISDQPGLDNSTFILNGAGMVADLEK